MHVQKTETGENVQPSSNFKLKRERNDERGGGRVVII